MEAFETVEWYDKYHQVSRYTQLCIVMMRTFRKQNEQVYISLYVYHIVSIWQFDCRNNIRRLSMYLSIFHTYTSVYWMFKWHCSLPKGEFEQLMYYISANWNCIVLLCFICYIFIWDPSVHGNVFWWRIHESCILDDQCLLQKNNTL